MEGAGGNGGQESPLDRQDQRFGVSIGNILQPAHGPGPLKEDAGESAAGGDHIEDTYNFTGADHRVLAKVHEHACSPLRNLWAGHQNPAATYPVIRGAGGHGFGQKSLVGGGNERLAPAVLQQPRQGLPAAFVQFG